MEHTRIGLHTVLPNGVARNESVFCNGSLFIVNTCYPWMNTMIRTIQISLL